MSARRTCPQRVRRGLALLALFAATAPAALAQPVDCRAALAAAEARYVDGSFGAVEPLLLPCLDEPAQAVPAYRLIALAALRQGDLVGAKLAVLRIFALRPDYAADAVQEPPDYVALVRTVRDQLTVSADPAAAVPERAPIARVPPQGPVGLPEPPPAVPVAPGLPAPPVSPPATAGGPDLAYHVWIGAGSYGGERGVAGDGAWREFAQNAGIAAGVGGTLALQTWLRAYADVGANFFPTLPTDKGDNFVFEPAAESSLSSYVYSVTVGIQLVPFRIAGVAPYGLLGGGVAVGGGGRVGGTATVGGGLDARMDGSTSLFVEGAGTLVSPARAIDAASWPVPDDKPDLLSGGRLGLRYRLGR